MRPLKKNMVINYYIIMIKKKIKNNFIDNFYDWLQKGRNFQDVLWVKNVDLNFYTFNGDLNQNSADAISKQINTLNEGYNNKEIDVEELSNGLSLVVVKKKWTLS